MGQATEWQRVCVQTLRGSESIASSSIHPLSPVDGPSARATQPITNLPPSPPSPTHSTTHIFIHAFWHATMISADTTCCIGILVLHTHTHARAHVRTHTHTYTHIHAHTHMHAHMNVYKHSLVNLSIGNCNSPLTPYNTGDPQHSVFHLCYHPLLFTNVYRINQP